MVRIGFIGCVLALATGCDINLNEIMDQFDGAGSAFDDGGSGRLSERARVVGSSDGMHVGEGDSDLAVVGLSGMTCQVETSSGWMYTDVDTTVGNETVEDGHADPSGGGDIVLVTSADTEEVVVVDSDDGTQWQRLTVAGLAGTRFSDDQVVTVSDEGSDGCVVKWWTEEEVTESTPIAGATCESSVDMAVDDGGRVWVTLGDKVAVVTESGSTTYDIPSDLVAFDAASNVVYTAMQGEDLVTAVETDGRVRWAANVAGAVVGLDDMGPAGQAVVSVEDTFAHSTLTFLDGVTGEVVEDVDVNRPAGEVVVADSGDAMGLGQEGGVDFFGIELE